MSESPFVSAERLSLWRDLTSPFVSEVKQRSGGAGRSLDYITARTVMNRLDDVLGPENWHDDYTPGEHGVVCKLTITLPDGMQVTKQDAGGYAGMADSGDDEKSGFSDAFKRAAVKFGIGRHLYKDGVPAWAAAPDTGRRTQAAPARQAPQQATAPATNGATAPRTTGNGEPKRFRIPKVNPEKAVYFAWAKELEEHYRVTLINGMKEDAKTRGFPTTFKDWTQEQANQIARSVIIYVKQLENYGGEFDDVTIPAEAMAATVTGDDEDIPF